MKFINRTDYPTSTLRFLTQEALRKVAQLRKRPPAVKAGALKYSLGHWISDTPIEAVEIVPFKTKQIFKGETIGWNTNAIAGTKQSLRVRVPENPPEDSGQFFAAAVMSACMTRGFEYLGQQSPDWKALGLRARVLLLRRCSWARKYPIDKPLPADRIADLERKIEKHLKALTKLRKELRVLNNAKTKTRIRTTTRTGRGVSQAGTRAKNVRGSARRVIRRA